MSEVVIQKMTKWQPIMLILPHGRLECACGDLAIFVTGTPIERHTSYNILEEVDVWCQSCFTKYQEREREDV